MLDWKFQSNSIMSFWVGARQSYEKLLSKKKLFSRWRAVAFKISHTMLNKMERLCKQCSKLAINTRGYFMTLAQSYRWGHKNSVIYFHFEKLSIIPVVSVFLTYNKYTALGNLSFLMHHFCFSIWSVRVNTIVYQNIETNKKLALERKLISLEIQ